MTRKGVEPGSRFGALVQAYRRKAGLTQKELALKAGLSVAALRDIEQSRRRRPRLSSVIALADALGLDSERAASMVNARRGLTSSQFPQRTGLALDPGPMEADQGLRLAVLGPLEAWRDGKPLSLGPPARRAVLGLLSMDPGALVRRDTIIDALWGEVPPRTATDLVQAHVSRLRKVLDPPERSAAGNGGEEVINSVRGAYRLRVSIEQVDLLLFRDLAAGAAAAVANGDDAVACELYEDAARLWRGDPLADVDMLSGHAGITLLRYQLTSVLLRYAELACALGQYRRVLPLLQALALAEPLNESAHARLMIALAGTGQQAAAIGVYEDLRSRLDRELGLYPSEELAEAHLRVLRQDIRAEGYSQHPDRPSPADRALAVPRQLPTAPRHFTGRHDELDALSGLLDRDSGKTTGVAAALTGRAGIGKTALAIYWAHQVADRFPDGQLYVNLHGASPSSTLVAPSEAVSGFLIALGLPVARLPAGAANRVALYRSLLADRHMLIVLDNARDAEHARSLLPGSPGCFVLVTSRNRLIGLAAAEGAYLLPLAAPAGETREEYQGLDARINLRPKNPSPYAPYQLSSAQPSPAQLSSAQLSPAQPSLGRAARRIRRRAGFTVFFVVAGRLAAMVMRDLRCASAGVPPGRPAVTAARSGWFARRVRPSWRVWPSGVSTGLPRKPDSPRSPAGRVWVGQGATRWTSAAEATAEGKPRAAASSRSSPLSD